MRYFYLLLLASLLTSLSSLKAQNASEQWQSVYYSDANSIYNPVSNISSPLKLLYNSEKSYSAALAGYSHIEGDFKPIDQGDKLDILNIGIDGLTCLDGFHLDGKLNYKNTHEYNQQWNTSLYASPNNPFILGSDCAGDRIIEEFDIAAGAAYQLNRVGLGLRLEYETGSLFSHSDPRTENYAMRFRAIPAVSYAICDGFTLGASAKVDIYNSQASHTIVNNLEKYKYYLYMGSGLYTLRTTADDWGYAREYNGNNYQASLQFILGSEGGFQNTTEISMEKITEISKDGSGSLIYRSGDYFATELSLSNRTSFARSGNTVSNIDLNFSLTSDEGYWYKQKKVVDTAHGNLTSYEVQMHYMLNSADIMSGGAAYQLALLKGDMPTYLFEVGAQYYDRSSYQNDGKEYIEDYSSYTINLDAKRYLNLGKVSCDISLNGAIKQNLGEPLYSGASSDITALYTNPRFAYIFSNIAQYGAAINASLAVGRTSRVGIKLGYSQYLQMGESALYQFSQTTQDYINTQLYLNF